MARPDALPIEVVYALPERVFRITLKVPAGTRVGEALAAAELRAHWPDLDLATLPVGVFGKPVGADYELRAGDRIELYRPLQADPKVARRARVQRQRKRGAR